MIFVLSVYFVFNFTLFVFMLVLISLVFDIYEMIRNGSLIGEKLSCE